MGKYAHLADPDIDFINRYENRIVTLIKELFEDDVISPREWEFENKGTYIALFKPSISKIGLDKLIKFSRTTYSIEDTVEEALDISGMICYLDQDDIDIAVKNLFGRTRLGKRQPTRLEKDLNLDS